MKYAELEEKLKPSQYRKYVKGWNKKRYQDIFTDSKYEHDRNGYRVYIPIEGKKKRIRVPADIKKAIEEKGYKIDDYVGGYAINNDNRKMKIGRLLKDNPQAQQKFMNDPQRKSTKNTYTTVISRHPYDIAGMSTDRGWTSCMNLDDGGYIRYVTKDVKQGTVVAYAVRSEDRNIQNPVCRVLIKPFINKNHPKIVHFGIEGMIYGSEVPGFIDVVREWVDEVNSKNELGKVITLKMKAGLLADQIKTISTNAAYVDNPPEKDQLTAVRNDGSNIRYFKNPSEKVKKTAVLHSPEAIRYIKNPSEEIKMRAIEADWRAIKYIRAPSEEIKMPHWKYMVALYNT